MPEKNADSRALDAIAEILRTENDVNGGDFIDDVTNILIGTGRDMTPVPYAPQGLDDLPSIGGGR